MFRSKFSSKAKFSGNPDHKQCANVSEFFIVHNHFFILGFFISLDFTFYYKEKIT